MRKSKSREWREVVVLFKDEPERDLCDDSGSSVDSSDSPNAVAGVRTARLLTQGPIPNPNTASPVVRYRWELVYWMCGRLLGRQTKKRTVQDRIRDVAKFISRRPRNRKDSDKWQAVRALDDPKLSAGQVRQRYEAEHGKVSNPESFERHLRQKRKKWGSVNS